MNADTPPQGPLPPAGWYPDPQQPGQRWWNGDQWGERRPAPPIFQGPAMVMPAEKSSGVATLLTILWPGAGHLYLGLSSKGTPYFIVNLVTGTVSFFFALLLPVLIILLFPICLVIWAVTLAMTIGSVSSDTVRVNQALQEGRRLAA